MEARNNIAIRIIFITFPLALFGGLFYAWDLTAKRIVHYFFYMFLNSKLDKIIQLGNELEEIERKQRALPKDSTSRRSLLMQKGNRIRDRMATITAKLKMSRDFDYDQIDGLVKARKKKRGL